MTAGGPPLPPPQRPVRGMQGSSTRRRRPPSYPVYPSVSRGCAYQDPHAGPAPGIGYAGFWIRFVAAMIDRIIIGVPIGVLFFVVEGRRSATTPPASTTRSPTGVVSINAPTPRSTPSRLFELVGLGVEFLYFVLLWSQLGGTLGQRMLGLHVVDAATGQNIGIGRAIGRFVGYVISSFALGIGLIWAAFDPRKQGWHDKIASTFVVRKV